MTSSPKIFGGTIRPHDTLFDDCIRHRNNGVEKFVYLGYFHPA